jgi:hypothetical protein
MSTKHLDLIDAAEQIWIARGRKAFLCDCINQASKDITGAVYCTPAKDLCNWIDNRIHGAFSVFEHLYSEQYCDDTPMHVMHGLPDIIAFRQQLIEEMRRVFGDDKV